MKFQLLFAVCSVLLGMAFTQDERPEVCSTVAECNGIHGCKRLEKEEMKENMKNCVQTCATTAGVSSCFGDMAEIEEEMEDKKECVDDNVCTQSNIDAVQEMIGQGGGFEGSGNRNGGGRGRGGGRRNNGGGRRGGKRRGGKGKMCSENGGMMERFFEGIQLQPRTEEFMQCMQQCKQQACDAKENSICPDACSVKPLVRNAHKQCSQNNGGSAALKGKFGKRFNPGEKCTCMANALGESDEVKEVCEKMSQFGGRRGSAGRQGGRRGGSRRGGS